MKTQALSIVSEVTSTLSNDLLTERVESLVSQEQWLISDLIVYLAELDHRRLYLEKGFSSLFAYLTEPLRLSNGSAFRRTIGARLYVRFPIIARMLREGRLTLVKLCFLRDLLTDSNHKALLEQASDLTEKQVQTLGASFVPEKPAPKDMIRAIPPSRSAPVLLQPTETPEPQEQLGQNAPITSIMEVASAGSDTPAPPETKHLIRMTVGPEFMGLLEQVKSALSHKFPNGSLEELLGECMRAKLAEEAKRKRGSDKKKPAQTETPAKPPTGRHIPASVRREVWERDGGSCTFESESGKRCGSTHKIQFHHLVAFALGGPATVANLTLLCAKHNDWIARQELGDAHMDRFKKTTVGRIDRVGVD